MSVMKLGAAGDATLITARLQFGLDPLQTRMLPKSRSGLLRTCAPVESTTTFTRSTEIGTSWSFGNPPCPTNRRKSSPWAPGLAGADCGGGERGRDDTSKQHWLPPRRGDGSAE